MQFLYACGLEAVGGEQKAAARLVLLAAARDRPLSASRDKAALRELNWCARREVVLCRHRALSSSGDALLGPVPLAALSALPESPAFTPGITPSSSCASICSLGGPDSLPRSLSRVNLMGSDVFEDTAALGDPPTVEGSASGNLLPDVDAAQLAPTVLRAPPTPDVEPPPVDRRTLARRRRERGPAAFRTIACRLPQDVWRVVVAFL